MPQQEVILAEGWDGPGSPAVALTTVLRGLWDGLAGQPTVPVAAVSLQLTVFPTEDMAVGDGIAGFLVPAEMSGQRLAAALFVVATAGTTGTCDIQIRRVRGGAAADMLSTKLVMASGALASAAPVIDPVNAGVATGDCIYIDVDTLSTTKQKGGMVALSFRAP
jgi:hypothetical protein